ncbi:uncharacterized protein BX664DRAFT_263233 [Halteromyces radiatus]|uniref:uncharacterized protein n=1 Tax=Halteromyces radiatus TaxID=101107 RepID=UPI00221F1D97|nr:uncharacterized protein BX664DRAFT_263233 [Halteromyces radiatus]KAI8089680.1 hypothetical protein BX664DRAFT_263233 [Halteromyces radiatus]
MSSVSSYDGSEKELFHQRTLDGFIPRHSYLRKTDFMDVYDNTRSRDTDTWSVAATVDDQESVISTNTQKSRLVHDVDDDNLTVDGITPTITANIISLDMNGHSLDIESLDIDTTASQCEDDKYERSLTSRSVAAEYGDRTTDGFGSEASLHDDNNDHDDDHDDNQSHNTVDDAIRAPTEPQPSIATVDKTYTHLLEENEMLQAQLRHLEITTKQQQDIINTMQSHHPIHHHQPYDDLLHNEVNSSILSQQLTTWAELVTGFAKQWTTSAEQQSRVEQDLFHHVMEYYLHALPFGTENQVLLNTAYQDQLARFHNTLGVNFAKWYRRQTVQSLARNPATHDYLHAVRMLITQHICRVLGADPAILTESSEWQNLLDYCARLSLELHSGEQDVLIRCISSGTPYDQNIMTAVDDGNISPLLDETIDAGTPPLMATQTPKQRIKCMVCPLFVDEQETVLLPARVILE